jgi:hypothetical protein
MTSERFDDQAAGRDAGDERLADEQGRRRIGEDAGDGALGDDTLEDEDARELGEERLNQAFGGDPAAPPDG